MMIRFIDRLLLFGLIAMVVIAIINRDLFSKMGVNDDYLMGLLLGLYAVSIVIYQYLFDLDMVVGAGIIKLEYQLSRKCFFYGSILLAAMLLYKIRGALGG